MYKYCKVVKSRIYFFNFCFVVLSLISFNSLNAQTDQFAKIGAQKYELQKDLLIDCQGNWGDNRTGDSAAAARYIEVRLSKFANDVVFNNQTTHWQLSYS